METVFGLWLRAGRRNTEGRRSRGKGVLKEEGVTGRQVVLYKLWENSGEGVRDPEKMKLRRKKSDGLEKNPKGGNIREEVEGVGKDPESIQIELTNLGTQVIAAAEGDEQTGERDAQGTLDIMLIEGGEVNEGEGVTKKGMGDGQMGQPEDGLPIVRDPLVDCTNRMESHALLEGSKLRSDPKVSWKRRARLQPTAPELHDGFLQAELGSGGLKRERVGTMELVKIEPEGRVVKKGEKDNDPFAVQASEVVVTSRDWTQSHK